MTVHRQHIRDPNVRMLNISGDIDNCTRHEPKKNSIFIEMLKSKLNWLFWHHQEWCPFILLNVTSLVRYQRHFRSSWRI